MEKLQDLQEQLDQVLNKIKTTDVIKRAHVSYEAPPIRIQSSTFDSLTFEQKNLLSMAALVIGLIISVISKSLIPLFTVIIVVFGIAILLSPVPQHQEEIIKPIYHNYNKQGAFKKQVVKPLTTTLYPNFSYSPVSSSKKYSYLPSNMSDLFRGKTPIDSPLVVALLKQKGTTYYRFTLSHKIDSLILFSTGESVFLQEELAQKDLKIYSLSHQNKKINFWVSNPEDAAPLITIELFEQIVTLARNFSPKTELEFSIEGNFLNLYIQNSNTQLLFNQKQFNEHIVRSTADTIQSLLSPATAVAVTLNQVLENYAATTRKPSDDMVDYSDHLVDFRDA